MYTDMTNWMEMTKESTQTLTDAANRNFDIMKNFWNSNMEQCSNFTKKNADIMFDQMGRNVDFAKKNYNKTVKVGEDLNKNFSKTFENSSNKMEKLFNETISTFSSIS
ncbi:MAG: hypothetical protein ACQETH_06285 [Candidatus Rifleibacteriota bacterium]